MAADGLAGEHGSKSWARLRVLAGFYIGVPSCTAILFALNHSGLARYLPVSLGIPYWLGLLVPYWLILDGASRAVVVATRPFMHLPAWACLLAGSLIGMTIVAPVVPYYAALFSSQLDGGATYVVHNNLLRAFGDLNELAKFSGVPLYWIGANLIYRRMFGVPEYLGGKTVLAEAPPQTVPEQVNDLAGIVQAMPPRLRGPIQFMRAEDHYVRVGTTEGEALVRYRFSDAVRELRPRGGLQVHRSYWVHPSFIERVEPDGKTYTLVTRNGSRLRVSRQYVGVLKSADLV